MNRVLLFCVPLTWVVACSTTPPNSPDQSTAAYSAGPFESGSSAELTRNPTSVEDYASWIYTAGQRHLASNNLQLLTKEVYATAVEQNQPVCKTFDFCGRTGPALARSQEMLKQLESLAQAHGKKINIENKYKFQVSLGSPDFKIRDLRDLLNQAVSN